MAPRKQLHMNFFDQFVTGSHAGQGQWKDPNDNSRYKDRLEYYQWLAKLADKGKITCIFVADVYGVDEKFQGSAKATFAGGAGVGTLDPLVVVSAMASVSKNVSFGITGSTSYINPYCLSRTMSTLDHLCNGRFAWNVVTSYNSTAAKAMGRKNITAHNKRYEEADEFMDLVYSLWEGSWEDGAALWSAENGAYDFEKVHKVRYEGKYHSTEAYGAMHPSPQRTPVIFQAGTSPSGVAFAAKHAEAVFGGGADPKEIRKIVDRLRAAAAANGRDPSHIKFFPQVTPVLGRTVEEAQEKYDRLIKNIDYEAGLAKMSSYLDIDFSKYPLDEPFVVKDADATPNSGIHAMVAVMQQYSDLPMTPRRIGAQMAFCGFAPMPVGTGEMVADFIEKWADEGDIDGINLAYLSNPMSYEDIVELLIPVLQERGLMWKDYTVPGGTFRENLLREPGQKAVPATHAAARFKYEELKKRPGVVDEDGDIWIKKV